MTIYIIEENQIGITGVFKNKKDAVTVLWNNGFLPTNIDENKFYHQGDPEVIAEIGSHLLIENLED